MVRRPTLVEFFAAKQAEGWEIVHHHPDVFRPMIAVLSRLETET